MDVYNGEWKGVWDLLGDDLLLKVDNIEIFWFILKNVWEMGYKIF